MDINGWLNKMDQLQEVTPEQIVEHYDKISSAEQMVPTATQIFLKPSGKYDAFFYYKVNADKIRTEHPKIKIDV